MLFVRFDLRPGLNVASGEFRDPCLAILLLFLSLRRFPRGAASGCALA
jgi:hypothetical protein